MPKYFCEYCGIYLIHSGPWGRRQHNTGKKHIQNKIDYYNQIIQEQKTMQLNSIYKLYPMNIPKQGMGYPVPYFNPGFVNPIMNNQLINNNPNINMNNINPNMNNTNMNMAIQGKFMNQFIRPVVNNQNQFPVNLANNNMITGSKQIVPNQNQQQFNSTSPPISSNS
jgi:U1 small nuclear ribonucleoprotein C